MSGAIRVREEMLLAACKYFDDEHISYSETYILYPVSTKIFPFSQTAEALAAQVTQDNLDNGLIYPPFTNIRKISAHIAAEVAAKAYELGELFSFCQIPITSLVPPC